MACYHPLEAWKPRAGGKLKWTEDQDGDRINVPCGQCIGCKLTRSLEWATRCMHEASMHQRNAFVTLTYDNAHLPNIGNTKLEAHRDFQKFMKRLRRQLTVFDLTLWTHVPRYYMAREYGDLNDRPHYHACIFGADFPDRRPWKNLQSGFPLYRSQLLDNLWTTKNGEPLGYTTTGSVTFESAAYVSRYCTKKVTGPRAASHYERMNPFTGEITALTPEYNQASLKPAIGTPWFNKYFHSDVADRDRITLQGGHQVKVPKHYDTLQSRIDAFSVEYTKFLREERAKLTAQDCTPERLATRERVAHARHKLKTRTL